MIPPRICSALLALQYSLHIHCIYTANKQQCRCQNRSSLFADRYRGTQADQKLIKRERGKNDEKIALETRLFERRLFDQAFSDRGHRCQSSIRQELQNQSTSLPPQYLREATPYSCYSCNSAGSPLLIAARTLAIRQSRSPNSVVSTGS